MENKLLTTKQVAEQLSCSTGKVLELAKDGFLRSIFAGQRTIRFTQAEVDRFIKDNMAEEYNVMVREK